MRRFRFRLQSILDLRNHEEEQRRLELGAATSRVAALRREIEDRRSRRRYILASRPEEIRADDVAWRYATEAYALRLAAEAERLEAERLEAEAERRAAAERYREAKQKADLLAKLREKRYAAYHKEAKREDQHRLDEVSQQMHIRGGA